MRTNSSVLRSAGLDAPAFDGDADAGAGEVDAVPTTLPSLMRLSITGGFATTRSAGAPELTLVITFASWVATTLCPLALWNPAARSRAPEIEPCEARIVISAARTVSPATPDATKRGAAIMIIHFRMLST